MFNFKQFDKIYAITFEFSPTNVVFLPRTSMNLLSQGEDAFFECHFDVLRF